MIGRLLRRLGRRGAAENDAAQRQEPAAHAGVRPSPEEAAQAAMQSQPAGNVLSKDDACGRENVSAKDGPGGEATPAASAERIAALQKMGADLHLFMRMAAMDILRREDDGYVMALNGETLPMPGVHTLFEAYLAIEEHTAGDWSGIEKKLSGPWTETVVRMVMDADAYRPLWERLRRQIAEEMTALIPRYGVPGVPDRRSLRNFTFLCMNICDRVTGTLGGGAK